MNHHPYGRGTSLGMGPITRPISRLVMGFSLGLLMGCALVKDSSTSAEPQTGPPPQYLPVTARWCLESSRSDGAAAGGGGQPDAGECIQLEAPRGTQQFTWGLQLRPALPSLRGMWFDFETPTRARFWMHRTLAPLDMIFLREGKVVAIEAEVPPCQALPCPSYGPEQLIDAVVELGAGQAKVLGIRIGSPARIETIPSPGSQPAATPPPARAAPGL